MSLFGSLFQAPLAPVPVQLGKISAPTAIQIAQASQPGPEALQLLTPQQSPSEYLAVLQEKQMGAEMVKTMAHGLSDREGVMWAAKSAGKVSEHLPEEEIQAMQAAQAWAQNPSEPARAAAEAAVAKTNLQGPGAWAAQAAAWSKADAQPSARLTPHAVSAAVMMASAIAAFPKHAAPKAKTPTLALPVQEVTPREVVAQEAVALVAPQAGPAPVIPPKVQAKTFRAQHPFIAMGLEIATGGTSSG